MLNDLATVRMQVLVLIVTIVSLVVVASGNDCEDKVEFHLGTKGPYRFLANKNYDVNSEDKACMKKILMVVRHGTRNPSARQIKRMRGHLPLVREIIIEKNTNSSKHLVKYELDLFSKWRSRVVEEDEKKLTLEGELEMLELAERMQARFPNILAPVYSNTSYEFKYTKTQRTKKSAKSFTVGLFGRPTSKHVYFPEPLTFDPILRFYKLCSKWSKSVKRNSTTLEERRKFEVSELMKRTVKRVSNKLGLGDILTLDDVYLMYTTCAFEVAWSSRRKSPWCIGFDLDSIKVMEYAEDLKYYWLDGYGSEVTYKQACHTFGHIIHFLESEEEYPKAVVYFTHSGTLLKLLAHMGLYKDEKPLLHNGYNLNSARKWRVSKMDSFGSNIAFVLHQCDDRKKLLVLHNERIVRLPACPDSDLCLISRLKNYYRDSIYNCSFDEICEN